LNGTYKKAKSKYIRVLIHCDSPEFRLKQIESGDEEIDEGSNRMERAEAEKPSLIETRVPRTNPDRLSAKKLELH
jgi:hypothetical protein